MKGRPSFLLHNVAPEVGICTQAVEAVLGFWDHILGSHFGITFWDHIRTQAAQDERDGQVGRVDTQLPLEKKKPSKTHLVFEQ